VVTVDALNRSAEPADDDRVERAILELNQRGTSDLDAPTMPAPWAGRR
jgi:hypothetical protein